MTRDTSILAWRIYPAPEGTEYGTEELRNATSVEMIFDYCQIGEASIFATGWKFLFDTYGMHGLIEINKRSGWFDEKDDGEAEQAILHRSRICGYDPELGVFGSYDEATGAVNPLDGGRDA